MIHRKAEMRFNAMFAELVGEDALNGVSRKDVPEGFRKTVDDGWTCDERGAWLLRDFLATYHGSPEAFIDVTGYEAAVNGRGVPDLDLTIRGKALAVVLARRGVAFARAALYQLNAHHPDHPPAIAYVTINELDLDDEDIDDGIVYEANVTFVAAHDGERPYLGDLDAVSGSALAAIDSAECQQPFG